MGLMAPVQAVAEDAGRLVITPHPVTLDGQRNLAADIRPGESLGAMLRRTVPDWQGDAWEVRINGVLVPHEVMERVRPKHGTVIEVRGIVKKQVLAIVAIAILAYFTMGAGLALYAGAVGVTSAVGTAVLGAVTFAAGSALINKALMPKPKVPTPHQADPVYSIGSARNAPRPYEPLPILFGTVRIIPDVASLPYSWYEGKDQIMGQVFTPGVNVHSVDALYNGETLLSTYEGVQVYHAGFGGMPEDEIPLFSNADTLAGGDLSSSTWVERTTGTDVVRLQINLDYLLGGTGTSGKDYDVRETVVAEYRPTGSSNWLPLVSRTFVGRAIEQRRATLSADVARGQYDVRCRILGTGNYTGKNTQKNDFSWVTLTAVQADEADYAGIPRIGVRIKASGQLNGALDEIRCVAHSTPVPVWDGAAWVTQHTSNPGAHLLAYARGIRDENGKLIAGIGLPEDMIDLPALQGFMLHCAHNGYTYDAYIKDARNHDEMARAIALAGMGDICWATGRLGVVWAAADQPLTGVVNMATIKRGTFQVDYTLAGAADGIEYTYVDPTDWQAKTLRVTAPGVATMLNPARVTGEGITSEAHAAEMARYHLAQSLYQAKDISFSTDLEHMSYRRMSMLSLQHDMTQWGYGGRVQGAVSDAGVVTLTLDEPVPPGATPYIGVRLPGDRAWRVFRVAPLAEESNVVTLLDEWPAGAPLPGNTADNPAHDSLWCYDFKATPGNRVRVVSIAPESDLKGARVAVVQEGPEFWNYVKNGTYVPAPNQSLLQTRPVASNIQISEVQVTQGDTVFTELVATFDVVGRMAYCTVHVSRDSDGAWTEPEQVAEARSNTARWRAGPAGTYRIEVRPYSEDGTVGGVAVATYGTDGVDAPPPVFDTFDVIEVAGGLRRYSWGYDEDTIQPANLAGAEIRYIAGSDPVVDWGAMTPLGDTGYFTAPFESASPAAGDWTFACRSRNTSGELSEGVRTVARTLGPNLGEVIAGLDPNDVTAELIELQRQIDEANLLRFQGDAAEALDRANAIAAEAMERQTAINAERAARELAVAAERSRIDAIDDDEIISQVEKPQLRIDYAALMDERAGINAEADLSEVVDEKEAYNEALDRLITYMGTLTTPTRWDDTSGNTNLT